MNAIHSQRARSAKTAWLALTMLLVGLAECSTASALPSDQAVQQLNTTNGTSPPKDIDPLPVPPQRVIRAGRYTLIELGPEDGQRNLMQQVVQTSIPLSSDATVGDALRFLLSRTGYQICDEQGAQELYALPLPAAHLRLGPMTLRQALLTLIGPAWVLQVDDASRRVCIAPTASLQSGPASAPSPAASPSAPTPSNTNEQAHAFKERP